MSDTRCLSQLVDLHSYCSQLRSCWYWTTEKKLSLPNRVTFLVLTDSWTQKVSQRLTRFWVWCLYIYAFWSLFCSSILHIDLNVSLILYPSGAFIASSSWNSMRQGSLWKVNQANKSKMHIRSQIMQMIGSFPHSLKEATPYGNARAT